MNAATPISRLPMDANTYEEVFQYYETRALEFLYDDYHWIGKIFPIDFGFVTAFTKGTDLYISSYVLQTNRGKGLYKAWIEKLQNNDLNLATYFDVEFIKNFKSTNKIITVPSCNLIEYFNRVNFKDYVVAGSVETFNWPEYEAIKNYYGDKRAQRSQVLLMNHIDEGLYILKKIGASIEAQKAFCLHPLYQNDIDLKENFAPSSVNLFSPVALIYVMEYRSVANEYLSARKVNSINEIRLSPLLEVNLMLVADKMQNYKDFTLFHSKTHKNSKDLEIYFNNWFKRLHISEKEYNNYYYSAQFMPIINSLELHADREKRVKFK